MKVHIHLELGLATSFEFLVPKLGCYCMLPRLIDTFYHKKKKIKKKKEEKCLLLIVFQSHHQLAWSVVALIVTARKMQSQRRQTVSPTTYVPGRPPAG